MKQIIGLLVAAALIVGACSPNEAEQRSDRILIDARCTRPDPGPWDCSRADLAGANLTGALGYDP